MNGRLAGAFAYAQEAHAGQKRRGCPIIAHLMCVSSVALFFGANEDEAIAALLHDTVEDCGGRQRLVDIRKKFGDVVAEIVDGCTDTYEDSAPPWRKCKQAYLVRMPEVSASAVFVSVADKLCNIEELIRFYREDGSAVWNIYVGGARRPPVVLPGSCRGISSTQWGHAPHQGILSQGGRVGTILSRRDVENDNTQNSAEIRCVKVDRESLRLATVLREDG